MGQRKMRQPGDDKKAMVPSYRTIGTAGQGEIKRKGSLFFGVADSADDPDQVEILLQQLSEQHPKASHHAYAYSIGLRRPTVRYSDDGEPGGTAGLPLVRLLQGRKLTNSVIVVTRIFGGTLLGTGGLARAYTDAGRAALQEAETVDRVLCSVLSVAVPYDRWGKLQHHVKESGYVIDEVEYTADVTVRVMVPIQHRDDFDRQVKALTGGAIQPIEEGKQYLSRK